MLNTPNKLTLFRIILVPFFMATLLIDSIPYNYLISILIFLMASITDMLDGKIARKTGSITDFGKFADPLADKLLVMSAFICFIELGISNSVVAMVILARELIITSIRLIGASKNKVIAANRWGKVKTVSQIVTILVVLFSQYVLELFSTEPISFELSNIFLIINNTLIFITVALTVVSGIVYIYENRNLIKELN